MRTILAALALLVMASAAQAASFPPETLRSVVSVLPEWASPGVHRERPEGTGVAVLAGGYVATNVHVIGRARRVHVRLHDGRMVEAEIVGRDRPTDIALLKVPVELPLLEVGPEPALAAPVCAVGNQFGLGLSVTCGVVSALRRSGTGFNAIEDFIQTDATVNPGGSGGALVDDQGRLVGLVSAIFTKQSDANIGVNFAASMALVLRVVEDLKAHGRVVRGQLGMRFGDLSSDARAGRGGALVVEVAPEGPAARAGLQVGDVIGEIAGRAIAKASDAIAAVQLHRPGERLEVVAWREGETVRVKVELVKQ